MIDIGLLSSIAIVLIVPSVFVPPWPSSAAATGLLDVTGGALLVGIAVGRLAAVAFDDPGSLTSFSDLLIIRSGVEFWPGLVAGLGWIAFRARHENVSPAWRLAAIATPALVAWACYEATCLLRDGCPGPANSIGLRPDGLIMRTVPVGLIVAGAAVVTAVALRRWHRRGMAEVQVVLLALIALASIRSVASIWLPHIGDALTRQHRTSIAVAVIAASALLVIRLRAERARLPVKS
jgi:hypothetical protein